MSASKETNASQTAPQTALPEVAPPEAYAAFVRIYMEWMEKEENEQVDLVEKNVRVAQRTHSRYTKNYEPPKNGPFGKIGSSLYGVQFGEYVNEVWVSFLKQQEDVDKFADYIQKDFERKQKRYLAERNALLKEIDTEIQAIGVAIQDMTSAQADQYMSEKYEEMSAKIEKWKKKYDINHYPLLDLLLRKPAVNMMSRLLTERKQTNKRLIPLDAKEVAEIEDEKAHGRIVEAELIVKDVTKHTNLTLTGDEKRILILKLSGYNNTEIANDLGIANSTVTKRIKKIKDKLKKEFDII